MKPNRYIFISRTHGGVSVGLEPVFKKYWDRFDFTGPDKDWTMLRKAMPDFENQLKCHGFVVDRQTMTIRPEEK